METIVQQVSKQIMGYGFTGVALVAFVGVCIVHGALKQLVSRMVS